MFGARNDNPLIIQMKAVNRRIISPAACVCYGNIFYLYLKISDYKAIYMNNLVIRLNFTLFLHIRQLFSDGNELRK